MYPILLFDGDCAFCSEREFPEALHSAAGADHGGNEPILPSLPSVNRNVRSRSSGFAEPGSAPVTEGRAVAAALRTGATRGRWLGGRCSFPAS